MEISDDELIYLAREKNQYAEDILYSRYYKNINYFLKEIYSYKEAYYDNDDLKQIALLKFISCVEKYDEDNGNFYSFCKLVIKRSIFDYLKIENKKIIDYSLNNFINDNEDIMYIDLICEHSIEYDKVKNDVINEETKEKIFSLLEDNERRILEYKLMGYSYKEISLVFDKPIKFIDNQLVKIKNKIKDFI